MARNVVKHPLQWVVCEMDLNELLLRHTFMILDGSTKSPDKFSGAIGSKLNGSVSEWNIVKFETIPCPIFPVLLHQVVNELSTDQHYGYCMSHAIITGDMVEDLSLLEVGVPNHSRWLTLACHIMGYFVSQKTQVKSQDISRIYNQNLLLLFIGSKGQ